MEHKTEDLEYSDEIARDLGVNQNPWGLLKFLDWNFYRYVNTFSEPRGDVSGENQSLPAIIHQFCHEDDDLSQMIQKRVCHSLSRWWWDNGSTFWASRSQVRSHRRGLLDMGPWLVLIGMRLPSFVNGVSVDKTGSTDKATLRVLMVILELPRSKVNSGEYNPQREGCFWGEEITLGKVLEHCYREGILSRPQGTDISVYRDHVRYVVGAIELMNIWKVLSRKLPKDPMNSAQTIFSLKMSKFWSWINDCESYEVSEDENENDFQTDNLKLEYLRKVGKLKVVWTEFLDEHLDLDPEEKELKLFWFGFSAMANPITHLTCQDYGYLYCHNSYPAQSPIFKELSKTYSLLFRSRKDEYGANVREYSRLPIPQWLRLFYGSQKGALSYEKAKDMSYILYSDRFWVTDIHYHLADVHLKLPTTYRFDRFVIWSNRLRLLDAYMKRQKPKGISQLWLDKRDTLQWNTFWLILILGGIGTVVSFLSLAVSVVQTWGTYKGLDLA